MSEEQRKDSIENGEKKEGQVEQYAFLQETIKDEQVNGKTIRNSVFKTAGRGLIFGLAACLAFYALKPWAETRFGGKTNVVTIPKDEEPEEDTEEEPTEEEVVSPVLTLDNYREMTKAMYQVAVGASKSVVEIKAIEAGDSLENTSYDETNAVSGVLIADTGKELLVLAPGHILKDAQSIRASFVDGAEYDVVLKKQDKNLGLAIFSVDRTVISDTTWGQIQVATLGNSNLVNRGDSMIALGSPFGYYGGIGYGIVSSVKNKLDADDAQFKLLNTDIPSVKNGSAVLFDLNGTVVGIADQTVSDTEAMNLVTAYAISDIKDSIERLSNGKAVAYIGIKGMEITEDISNETGIPQGIYVREVEADSPAMKAGIQTGDVITKFNKSAVSTISGYRKKLEECEPGEEIKVNGQRQGASEYVNIDFTVTVGSKE